MGFSLPQDAPGGTTDTKSRSDVKLSQLASNIDSGSSLQTTETRLADLLDSTLWNRKLAPSSERIVYALVQQIFQGIREYFLASAELKVCSIFGFTQILTFTLEIGVPYELFHYAVQLFSSDAYCG